MNKDNGHNKHNQDSDPRTKQSPNLEHRCKKALLRIADDVRDINFKLTHFLESYREDSWKSDYNKNTGYHEIKYQPGY